ncbi:MAG TPA: LysR family transcriptional regulator [Steroidobacteraceae bacterium]|nr:LysR family transcriptional regulator [Steroidobacteraceae bacterium]
MSSKNTRNVIDLNHTLLFVEVVRAGSFAQAGQRVGMPANSVSRKIGQLELQLGSRLIHRSTRKLSLTAAGREFFERCEPSVATLVLAGKEWSDGETPAGSVIRVAAPTDFFDVFRLEWITEFLRRHPRLRMEFLLDDAKADLIAASIDVAFRAKHLVEAWHVGHKLIDSHFALVASPAYVSSRGAPATPQALAAHDCLVQSSRPGAVTWQLQGPDGPHGVEVSGRFRANASRVVLQAAVAGLGIALLPDSVTAPDLAAGHLVRVLRHYRRDGADLYAVYASRHQIPQAVLDFVTFTAEKVRSALQFRAPQSENITR